MMTVRDLMERLEDMDPDAEVRLMTQQHYPLEAEVLGVCDNAEMLREEDDEGEDDEDGEEPESVVYIVEGTQIGYGLKKAWNCAS
jgi:hypothetical protein